MLQLNELFQRNNLELQKIHLVEQVKEYALQQGKSELESQQVIKWTLEFSHFHNKHHPADLSHSDIESFLSSLATEKNCCITTQRLALKALKFLYLDFLNIPLNNFSFISNKNRRRFTDKIGYFKCQQILNFLKGTSKTMAELVVAGGLKLPEVVSLRLSDLDFKKNQLIVRDRDGKVKFILNIPMKLILELRIQAMRIKSQLERKNIKFNQPANHFYEKHQLLFPFSNKVSTNLPTCRTDNLKQLAYLKNEIRAAIKRANFQNPQVNSLSTPVANSSIRYLKVPNVSQTKLENLQSSFEFEPHHKNFRDFKMAELRNNVA